MEKRTKNIEEMRMENQEMCMSDRQLIRRTKIRIDEERSKCRDGKTIRGGKKEDEVVEKVNGR